MKNKLLLVLMAAILTFCFAAAALAEGMPSLNIVQENVTLSKGKNSTLTVETENITGKKKPKVVWQSEDAAIASVANGKVTGKAAGTTTITANITLEDGTQLADSCEVTVIVPTSSITISTKAKTLVATDCTLQLAYEVKPASATDPTILWASSDESIATVDANGCVTGVAEGSVTVTATAADGGAKPAKVQLNIVPKLNGEFIFRVNTSIERKDGNYVYNQLTPFTTMRAVDIENADPKMGYAVSLYIMDTPENGAVGKAQATMALDGQSVGKPVTYNFTGGGYLLPNTFSFTKEFKKLAVGTHTIEINVGGTVYTTTFDISDGSDITGKPADATFGTLIMDQNTPGTSFGDPGSPSLSAIANMGQLDVPFEYYALLIGITNCDAKTDFGEVKISFQGNELRPQSIGILEPNASTALYINEFFYADGSMQEYDDIGMTSLEPGDYTFDLEIAGEKVSVPFTLLP